MLESRECYGCGETRHIRRNCPKPSYRPPISRGRGGHGRGRYSGGRGGRGDGGHQNGRGNRQSGTTTAQHGRGNGQSGDRAHCYAFPERSEAETSDAVITGNILVCVLFDPGSAFSYISSSFANGLNLHCELLDMPIRVSTPVGEFVIVEKVYRSCLVTFVGGNTQEDLVILEMVDFDEILGMTWLSPNFAILDFNAKTVTLAKL